MSYGSKDRVAHDHDQLNEIFASGSGIDRHGRLLTGIGCADLSGILIVAASRA